MNIFKKYVVLFLVLLVLKNTAQEKKNLVYSTSKSTSGMVNYTLPIDKKKTKSIDDIFFINSYVEHIQNHIRSEINKEITNANEMYFGKLLYNIREDKSYFDDNLEKHLLIPETSVVFTFGSLDGEYEISVSLPVTME